MSMMSKKTKIIAAIALLYILIAGSVLASVVYEVSVSGEALTSRVGAIAEKNARSRVFKELQKSVDDSIADRAALAGYVLTEDDTSAFLTDLEDVGNRGGVHVTTDSLKVIRQDKSFVDQLVIDFSLTGNEAAVKRMLTLFETLPYHSQVTAFALRKNVDGSAEGTLELTVSLLKNVQ